MLLFIVGSYFLYTPPDIVTSSYFAIWFIVFYLGATLFGIPYLAWGGELDKSAQGKTKIFSFRTAFEYLGQLLFYAVPLLPFFATREITPETLRFSVIAASLIMLPLLYLSLTTVPNGYSSAITGTTVKPVHQGMRVRLNPFLRNKPLLLFLGFQVFFGISAGMWYALIFIYVDIYLGMGNQFAQVFMLAFVVGILMAPIWYSLSKRLEKTATLCVAAGLLIVSFIYTGLLKPAETHFIDLLLVKTINTMGFSCFMALAPSLMADIVDYSHWKFRINQAATYFSIYIFTLKASLAFATALALTLVGRYGFDATLTKHAEESVWGLQLAIAWLPPVFMLLALLLLILIPITAHRHSIIRRRLDVLASRAERETKNIKEKSLINTTAKPLISVRQNSTIIEDSH